MLAGGSSGWSEDTRTGKLVRGVGPILGEVVGPAINCVAVLDAQNRRLDGLEDPRSAIRMRWGIPGLALPALREYLGLGGTTKGCDRDECGA